MPPKKVTSTSKDKKEDKKPAASKDKEPTKKKDDVKKPTATKDDKKKPATDDKKSSSKDPEKTDDKDKKGTSKDPKKDDKKDKDKSPTKDAKKDDKKSKASEPDSKTSPKKIDRAGVGKVAKLVEKPKAPEKPSTFVKELRLGAKFSNIEGMNLIEENETEDYFDATRLDNYLVLAIREVIKGKEFPKNPFPRILRSLKQSLWYNTSSSDVSKRREVTVENFIEKKEIGYNIYAAKRNVGVYGYKYILAKVNLDTITFIKKYFSEYLIKNYERRGDYDVDKAHQINTDFSLAGSFILEGFMLPYPLTANKYFEINYHLTITGPLLKKSLDMAIKIIYEDMKKCTEMAYANLFSSLHITGKDDGERVLIIWKLEDIVNQRQLFLTMLEQAIIGRHKISMKYLHKTKISRDDFFSTAAGQGNHMDYGGTKMGENKIGEGLFNTRYFKTWKTYHFHFIHSEKESQTQSFSYFPVGCLLQGVFLDPDAAVRYAQFFYKPNDNLLETTAYKLYLVEQAFALKSAWESQNIPQILWNSLYLILLEEEKADTKLLLTEIYRMLSVIPACLKTIAKMMNMTTKLIEAYMSSEVEDFKLGAINELRIVQDYLEEVKMNYNYPEGSYMKDTISKYIFEINKIVTYAYPEPMDILKIVRTGGNLFDVVADSNFQILFNNSNRVSQFVVESLLANNFFEDVRQPLTYMELDKVRLPSTTLSLEKASSNFQKIVKLKAAVNNDEAEEFIILAYMEKTGIYQKMRDVLYDVYYGKKFPNPLPRICNKIEDFNRKHSDVVLSKNVIEEELYRPDTRIEEAEFAGKKVKDYYWATNQDVIDLNLKPMYGLLAIIKSIPLQNLDTILYYMEEFNWRGLCRGVGDGYHFEDILSLSPKSIFQNPDLFTTDDTIIELNHDFYFEEASLTQALQAVASIYFEMMTQLDLKYQEKKIVPIGFYETGILEAFITFNDITNGLTSRTGLLELLIKSMNKGKNIHCKFVAVITKKGVVDFKLFKINMNVLLIEGNSIFSAKKELISTDFLRFFTNSRDASYFSTYVPYNKMQILSCLSKERDEAQMEGKFTQSMVVDTIFSMVEGNRQQVLSNVSVLANKALFIAKLGEKYDLLYQLTYIIQAGSASSANSWISLELPVVDKFFDDFYAEMRRSFADYESIHLDGLLSRVMNLHQFVYKLFQKSNYTGKELEYIWDKAKWIKLRKTIAKIKGMLEAMSSYLLIVSRTRVPTGF